LTTQQEWYEGVFAEANPNKDNNVLGEYKIQILKFYFIQVF